jgi:hypothetical protein
MKQLFIFILIFTLSAIWAQNEVRLAKAETLEEYQTLLKIAREKENLLLVTLHQGSNTFRSMFEAGVFKEPNLVSEMQNYTTIAIDVRDAMGAQWVSLFPADSLPTFYFLNNQEFLLAKLEGFQNPEKLRETANQAKINEERYEELLKKYNANNLDKEEWIELIDLYSLNFSFTETTRLVNEFLNNLAKADLLSPTIAPLLNTYALTLENQYLAFVIENRKALSNVLPSFKYSNFYERAYSYNLDLAVINEDTVLLQKIIDFLIPASPLDAQKRTELWVGANKLFAEETKQYSYYVKAVLKQAENIKEPQKEAAFLFDEGFTLADNHNETSAIEAANKLAKASLTKAETYKAKMLESYTSYLLKNFDLATEQARKAMALSENSKEVRQASGLLKMIESEKEKKN